MIAILAAPGAVGATASGPEPGPSKVDRPGDRVEVPPPSPKAVRYYESGVTLWFVARAWGLGVPALILWSGLSARLRTLAAGGKGSTRPWIVGVAAYGVLFLAVEFLLNLPLRYYAGFVRSHEYGLSVQSIGRWSGDALKGLGVEMVGAVLFLWVPYAIMARSPRRWWLYVGLLALPFGAFSAVIAPVAVDPLFNDFGPMKDKALEAKIEALARRAGIDGGKIFEVDKSKDTTTVNAHVTGLFGTKRIVLWDTLLAKLEDDEVLVIMGHEMGHYVLDHVAQGLILSSIGTILALYLIHRAADLLIRRSGGRFGFDRLSDVASVPLVLLLVQVVLLVAAPATNGVSRHLEHEADRFALEITKANRQAALGFVKLQADNLSIPRPGPLAKAWRWTHPPIGERIEFCNAYRPWEAGQPLRYAHLFRGP